MGHAGGWPLPKYEARIRGFKDRRAVADPFARQRGHRIQQKRCFAAEVWDAKGLAIPTLGYEDAALRLKFGSCEDDGPSQCFESRCRAVGERGEHSRLDCERHQQKHRFAAEVWDATGLAIPVIRRRCFAAEEWGRRDDVAPKLRGKSVSRAIFSLRVALWFPDFRISHHCGNESSRDPSCPACGLG